MVYTADNASLATADYYVFNNANGYVVVAGDDCVPAVLAYSDEGAFDINNMPDGMRMMLETYAQLKQPADRPVPA